MNQPLQHKLKTKKVALVLSGGMVRAAAWHLGVALALEELGFTLKGEKNKDADSKGIDISTYVGSSAGSMISCYFANGYGPQEIINATIGGESPLKAVRYSDMFYLWRPKIKTPKPTLYDPLGSFPYFIRRTLNPIFKSSGFFSTEGLKKYLQKNVNFSEDFKSFSADLFVIATQLDHSRKVIFGKYDYPNPLHDDTSNYYTGIDVADAVAASMAVPPFYTPFPIKNKKSNTVEYYIDGEIRDTLSTHVAIDNRCDFIISSWTHTPYHFHDEIGSLAHYGIPSIAVQAIYLMIQKKIVDHRAHIRTAKDLIDTIHSYMATENFSDRQRKEILKILENKLNYKSHIQFLDIYPDHDDFQTFFANPFSLEKNVMSQVIRQGYKKTLKVFSEL